MPFKGPFLLGPFSVDVEGRLSLARLDRSPGFSIRWRGRTIHACLARGDGQAGRLYVQAILGKIPGTTPDPAMRDVSVTVLRALLGALPDAWTVRLLPDHGPLLDVIMNVDLPITVTNLVTELASFVLDLSPYLDVLDRVGVWPDEPPIRPLRLAG